MADDVFAGMILHITQAGEIVKDLALRTLVRCREAPAFLKGAHLFQGQWVAPNGGGGVEVGGYPCAGRVPGKLNCCPLNAFPQGGHFLYQREQSGANGVSWFV